MPRRLNLTRTGREFLRPRFDVRRTALSRSRGRRNTVAEQVIVDGQRLNLAESTIYRALEIMGEDFQSQVAINNPNDIGGGKVDFVLPGRNMALEYQGPFHVSSGGKARDIIRRSVRQQAGLYTVELYLKDITDEAGEYSLHDTIKTLKKLIGFPVTNSLMRRAY